MTRLLPAAATAVVLLLAAAGCSTGGDPVPYTTREQLAQRPSLEEQRARFEQLQDEVQERLGAELGLTAWSPLDSETTAACDNGEVPEASIAFLQARLLTGGVPDASWQQAVDVLVEVAEPYGFDSLERVVDDPGEHEVVLRGEHEALIRFGTLQNATLGVTTGCHLMEAGG